MRDPGKLPTWLKRRGYSKRLKRVLAQRAARRRSVPACAPPAYALPGVRISRGDNVVPFPVRMRAAG